MPSRLVTIRHFNLEFRPEVTGPMAGTGGRVGPAPSLHVPTCRAKARQPALARRLDISSLLR